MRTTRAWLLVLTFGLLALLPRSGNAADIVVVFALQSDLESLCKAQAQATVCRQVEGDTFLHEFQIGPHRVKALQFKARQHEAAAIVAKVLKEGPVDLLVSVGPAGALVDELVIGEWVAVGSYATYSGHTFRAPYPPGTVQTRAPREDLKLVFAKYFGRLQMVDSDTPRAFRGPIHSGSGSFFVASPYTRAEVRTQTQAQLVEMDVAGIDHAARGANVPAIFWRVVSNRAGGDARHEYHRFTADYDGRGGRLVAEAIKALPAE